MKYLPQGLLLCAGLALFTSASLDTGDQVPDLDMEIVHPVVDSFDDFRGRAVLVEFFAHW